MTTKLSALPAQVEFTYKGKRFKTLTVAKRTILTGLKMKRDVMDMKTFKTLRLSYSLLVEFSENSEKTVISKK